MVLSKSSYIVFEEVGEDLLFIIWSAWQYLRIIMLIKNQNKAKHDADDIIEFTNVEDVEDVENGFGRHNSLKLQLDDKPRK